MKSKVVIIGAGGFGREVLDIFEARNQAGDQIDILGFIVDAQYGTPGRLVNGFPILGGMEWLSERPEGTAAICAIGDPAVRRRMVDAANRSGVPFCNAIHPSVIATRHVKLGVGVVLAAGSILTNNIAIDSHVHLNLDCTVGHDARIGACATVSPGVHISGGVTLGEGCSVGTGTNIIEKCVVGEWSVVGAGSTIVRDVPANSTVVGVPGRVIKQRAAGWHLAPA